MTARPLHRQVQRRWLVERRGGRAGVAAVVVAVGGALLGLDPWVHLALLFGAAALAAAWPTHGDERRALRWVGERAGLAYETAWELSPWEPPAPAGPAGGAAVVTDSKGAAGGAASPAVALRAAVAVEGRLSIRDLTPPPVAAWWLPLGVLALGLWGWAALAGPLGGGTGPTFAAPPPPASPSGPVTPASDDAALEPVAEEESEVEAELPTRPSDARGGEAGSAPPGGEGGAEGGDGASSERDALERFLDRLRERPPDEAPARVTPAELGLEPDADGEEGDAQGEAGEARDGERPDGADGDRAPEAGAEGADGDGDGGGEAGDTDGAGAAPAPEGPPDDEDAGEGLAPDTEGSVGASGLDEGGDEASAGIGVGAAGDLGPGTDPAAGDPEPLPSILGPGPESPVGGVVMPGVAPADPFPPGAAGGTFRRAVEEALGEGDLPAPYQEIIRNYFR